MAPLIGLNIDINVHRPDEARITRRYFEAVEAAGGVPVLIPPMSDAKLRTLLRQLHGVMMIGGRDYAIASYGGDESAPHDPLHPIRQDFDMRLGRMLQRHQELPVLYICAGMQLLTILHGGRLVEHIPAYTERMLGAKPEDRPAGWQAVAHQSADGHAVKHPVALVRGTKIASAYRTLHLPEVVSSHHQGSIIPGNGAIAGQKRTTTPIKRLILPRRRLIVSATAADGIIEAVELPGHDFCVGVQWHPEFEPRSPIIRSLVRHATAYARS